MADSCGHSSQKKYDYFFIINLMVSAIIYVAHFINQQWHFSHLFYKLINQMSLGIILGIIFIGVLGRVPRDYIFAVVGKPLKPFSILRATAAGVLLDLCSHGILMVGAKLYQRGASLGQVMAFLIASPWNSFSLTVILVTLVGLKLTLLFILLSALIALLSGFIFDQLTIRGVLPKNENQYSSVADFSICKNISIDLKATDWSFKLFYEILVDGLKHSRMILRWLLFGALLSTLITYFIDTQIFQEYFGPSLLGLGLTLFFATIIEVCSEGSVPIAADLVNRAQSPGNGFVFLMAGVSTDYTEVMIIKDTTKSWKIALFLPLITVPQILVLGWILNTFSI